MEDLKDFNEFNMEGDFLNDLEPYDINDTNLGMEDQIKEEVIQQNGDQKYRKDPFFRIYSRYFIKPNKEKSQACRMDIYLQYNRDKFFSKGLVIVPVIKFHFGRFKEMVNEINPSFYWEDSNIFWIYGWDKIDKFFNILNNSLKSNGELKDQILNLNEKVKKSLDFYKPENIPVVILSLNKINDKSSVKFSLSPDSIKELLLVRNMLSQIAVSVLSIKFANFANGK